MALKPAQTAGIVIATLIIAFAIVACILIYFRHSRTSHQPTADEPPQEARDPALPGPLHNPDRPRPLVEGRPYTFYDWVRATNAATVKQQQGHGQGHDRYPSLEHGPGPAIVSRPAKPLTSARV